MDSGKDNTFMYTALILLVVGVLFYFFLMNNLKTGGPIKSPDVSPVLEVDPNEFLPVNKMKYGTDPMSTRDGIPRFNSGFLYGYECVRCSDSGAKDKVKDPLDPDVLAHCSAYAAQTWQRGNEANRLSFERSGKQFGNFASHFQPPATTDDPLADCIRACEENQYEGMVGKCQAVTYDKNKNVCQFFYACNEVKKNKNKNTFIRLFNPSAQPDVVVL